MNELNRALLTYAEAAAKLNLKLGTLYALVAQGRIPHVRLGPRFVRFYDAELDAWVQCHAVRGGVAAKEAP